MNIINEISIFEVKYDSIDEYYEKKSMFTSKGYYVCEVEITPDGAVNISYKMYKGV